MAERETEWKFARKLRPIKVKDNMSRDVQTVAPGSQVLDTAQLMRDQNIGCVLVKEDGKLIGVITDRDIACRVTAEGRDPRTTTAKSIMTDIVDHCSESDTLYEAAKIMMEKRVHRLPVLDRNEDLVGLLSVGDLSLHTDHALLGEVMSALYAAHK